MDTNVEIRMLGEFSISAGGQRYDHLIAKSRKGVSLIEYLILQRGKTVPAYRLIREMGASRKSGNPEGALKTMISRSRSLLSSVAPGLGKCVESESGGYRWQAREGVWVDALEIMDLFEKTKKLKDESDLLRAYRRVMALYGGDLFHLGDMGCLTALESGLHREYLNNVYAYINLLKEREQYNEICQVCRDAIRVDDMDEQLHIELMRAMASLNRAPEALAEYERVKRLIQRQLNAEPSEDMQACYRQLMEAGKKLSFNLDTIRNELLSQENERRGPFFCDYQAFKEIYNLQMRNLERLGSTMFLGVMMVGDENDSLSSAGREGAIAALTEILRDNLRKGDIITRFSPSIIAMLLPTVNYETGSYVMERIEKIFYQEYPSKGVVLHSRVSPLGENTII